MVQKINSPSRSYTLAPQDPQLSQITTMSKQTVMNDMTLECFIISIVRLRPAYQQTLQSDIATFLGSYCFERHSQVALVSRPTFGKTSLGLHQHSTSVGFGGISRHEARWRL